MARLLSLLALVVLTQCSAPRSAKTETAFTNSLGMPFIRVPGISALVCRHETRVKDFQAFATATRLGWRKPDFPQTESHPAVNVNWPEAKAFCDWLGQNEGRKYRLLTDAEWSVLAGLREDPGVPPKLQPPSTGIYHWGARPLARNVGNLCDKSFGRKYHDGYEAKWLEINDGYPETAPVGRFPPHANGLLDFSGNVWEWVDGWYDPPENTLRIVRGGAFRTGGEKRLLASFRGPDPYGIHLDSVGFRVACDPD